MVVLYRGGPPASPRKCKDRSRETRRIGPSLRAVMAVAPRVKEVRAHPSHDGVGAAVTFRSVFDFRCSRLAMPVECKKEKESHSRHA